MTRRGYGATQFDDELYRFGMFAWIAAKRHEPVRHVCYVRSKYRGDVETRTFFDQKFHDIVITPIRGAMECCVVKDVGRIQVCAKLQAVLDSRKPRIRNCAV